MANGTRRRAIVESLDFRGAIAPDQVGTLELALVGAGAVVGLTAAGIYSTVKGTYRLMNGDKALKLYGDKQTELRDFDALREKITTDPSRARLQLAEDRLNVVASFQNDANRYELPSNKLQDAMYMKLCYRQFSNGPLGRNPICQIEQDKLENYINLEQREEHETEQAQNRAEAGIASNHA